MFQIAGEVFSVSLMLVDKRFDFTVVESGSWLVKQKQRRLCRQSASKLDAFLRTERKVSSRGIRDRTEFQ